MKKIGIIVAMEEELEKVKNIASEIKEKKIFELNFLEGKISKKEIVIIKCGVGKVNAARVTQIMIDNFNVELIINVGAAGALNPNLDIGDVVIGTGLVQHDFDITAFGHSKGFITGVGNIIYTESKIINKLQQAVQNIKDKAYKVKTGVIASGDIFCTDINMKNKIYTKFNADCVEMEGAAIAQVCMLDKIPFVIIRSISDTPNGENAMVFDEFVHLASERCADILKSFLQIM